MKKLILTGWGWKDYACAAALALRRHTNAEVLGMSMRRLPEFLNEVSGCREIIILGIGLTGDPALLEKALARLRRKNIRTVWVSALPAPENLDENLLSKIEPHIGGSSVTSATSLWCGLPCDDLAPLLSDARPPADLQPWHHLFEAAMYFYRNYQDQRAYGRAIRHLALRTPPGRWSDADRTMIDHYKRYGNRELVGKSPAMTELQRRVNHIAAHDRARVLIHGESGTGKETVALQLHTKSPRRAEPFIAFNCASVTPNLLESRFFGHEKGAFTGASETRPGLFEQAAGGTLFLDEIGELPLEAQGVLLRVLEGGRFMRIGGREEIEADVRLLTATNRDLAAMVRDGAFREDLFHRLNVIQIRVPPLREHKDDIATIANAYWLKRHRKRLDPAQLEAFAAYDYPGNVRELLNLLERASVLGETDFARLLDEHRLMNASLAPQSQPAYPDDLAAMTRLHVRRVFEKHGNNFTKTADALNVTRNTVKKYLA